MVEFDQLIRGRRDTDAVRYLSKEYYNNGKMGYTRKMLLERIADKCDNLSAQLAEAQADNAALVEALSKGYFGREVEKILADPHPGADLLKELEQLQVRLNAYNGFEPCDFKSLDAKNKGLEETIESYKSLLPELLDLRKVRDAAEKVVDNATDILRNINGSFGIECYNVKSEDMDRLIIAIAQAKGRW